MTRRRKLLIFIPLAVALLGGAVAIVPPLLFGDGVDYSHAISIKSSREYQDPALLEKAWALPVAATYRRAGVEYQGNPSFCGPTTAVNLMHSLGHPADQKTILDGTGIKTIFGLVFGGVTLDQLANVVREKSGRPVTVLRDLDLARFREELKHANDPSRRYLVNFHRGPLFGRGGGHHSPIGGYLADEDLVLVIDVNEKYKPWLVKTERLFAAVDTNDKLNGGKKRGLLLVE